MRRFFHDIAQLIRDTLDAYAGVQPDSVEGRMVMQLRDTYKQLQKALAEGIYQAGETFRQAEKNSTGEGGVRYSLNANAETELHKALYDTGYRNEVLLRDNSPEIMVAQHGVVDRPMAMKASHIRENVFTKEEAELLGLPVTDDINYHGLGEKFFLKIIDGLDNVKEAYRGTRDADNPSRRENYFLLISEFTDGEGNTINVPVYIDEHAQCNRVFIEVNKISTVFGKQNFREYIKRQISKHNLVRIKNRSIQTSERSAPIAEGYGKDASMDSIRNPDVIVKKISETDSGGNRFSVRQKQNATVADMLKQEVEKLKGDVAKLKELLKLQRSITGGTKFTASSVEAAARVLKKNAGATGDTAELAGLLNRFYEYIATEKELTWEGVKEQAKAAADWLQEHVKHRRSDYAQEILDQLHGSKIYLDESQKQEAAHHFGSFNAFRQAVMGSITVANEASTSLDSFWQEMSALYPDVFDAERSDAVNMDTIKSSA